MKTRVMGPLLAFTVTACMNPMPEPSYAERVATRGFNQIYPSAAKQAKRFKKNPHARKRGRK